MSKPKKQIFFIYINTCTMDLVDRFDLPLKKIMKKFSRGMVMKAAIVIALSHHADFIIMDEPTSGLDPVFRRELLDLLYELLQNEKKSILFSTHITSDLEKIADYVTLILDGKIIFLKNYSHPCISGPGAKRQAHPKT